MKLVLASMMSTLIASSCLAADSPDAVVAGITSSYQQRNLVTYDQLVSPEFSFEFSDQDVLSGLPSSYDRAQELAVTEAMFSGQPGQTPDGELIPPIAGFEVFLTPVDGSWSTQVPPELTGTQVRRYATDMVVSYADDRVLLVQGIQEFYVEEVSSGVWQLRHWRDLGVPAKRPSDPVSWGQLKAGSYQPVATETGTFGRVKLRY